MCTTRCDIVPQRRLEHLLGAQHVGLDEVGGADDRPVDVRLGGEVDQDVVAGQRGVEVGRRADVAAHEAVPGAVGDRRQVGQVAGVGQLVEHRDLGAGERRVGVRQQLADVVRADEAGSAGDEHTHDQGNLFRAWAQDTTFSQLAVSQSRRARVAAYRVSRRIAVSLATVADEPGPREQAGRDGRLGLRLGGRLVVAAPVVHDARRERARLGDLSELHRSRPARCAAFRSSSRPPRPGRRGPEHPAARQRQPGRRDAGRAESARHARRRRQRQHRHDDGAAHSGQRPDGDRRLVPARLLGRHPGQRQGQDQLRVRDGYAAARSRGANELASESAGVVLLIQTIKQLTGLHIDHYVQVNLLGFYRISNAIGGVHGLSERGAEPEHRHRRIRQGILGHQPAGRRIDDQGHAGAGLRPAAARPAERRPRPDQAPAVLPVRGLPQGRVGRRAAEPVQAARPARARSARRCSPIPAWTSSRWPVSSRTCRPARSTSPPCRTTARSSFTRTASRPRSCRSTPPRSPTSFDDSWASRPTPGLARVEPRHRRPRSRWTCSTARPCPAWPAVTPMHLRHAGFTVAAVDSTEAATATSVEYPPGNRARQRRSQPRCPARTSSRPVRCSASHSCWAPTDTRPAGSRQARLRLRLRLRRHPAHGRPGRHRHRRRVRPPRPSPAQARWLAALTELVYAICPDSRPAQTTLRPPLAI